MELTAELGTKIIDETKKLIDENIIIVDKEATIIASTDTTRIGDFHEGAKQTIEKNTVTILTSEHQKSMKGIKPGVNLPITIHKEVIGVIGITGNPTEIIPFASLMKKMTELLIRESMYIHESEWAARALEVFFLDWVQLETVPQDFIQRAEVLGINLKSKLLCTLIYIHQNNDAHNMNELINWLELTLDSTVVRWGNDRLLMVTEEKQRNASANYLLSALDSFKSYAESNYGSKLSIGVGTVFDTKAIKPSYQRAEKALRVAMNTNSIIFYEDLLLEICLDDVDESIKVEFINRIITPLKKEPELLNTLRAYLNNNLHVKNTSLELHIHINTLHYRLKQIHQLTNLNPRDTYSIASFYTALYYLDEKTN
ncbi:carbohydrate diacid regulator [Ornithinibacillus sp. L9]|uniref:Carbohydrate diacid regulator n=1 Tax=Ornithinibacillus caprae TaxID=2678566 RepID=A0A6N8FQE6_9BACI|nr:sugar diacid recognition domain-containing protein [Ornithinibacillus caprae]MUK90249.1 carbohydrate diacid regulator [Ornithinibacillus caprae]